MSSSQSGPGAPLRLDFSSHTVVVTGAARGIGRAVASAFASAGASLVLCDRLGPELQATRADLAGLGVEVDATVLDVRDRPSVIAWASAVATAPGSVSVLVNNVGGGFVAPFMDLSPNAQAALVAENFTQVADVTRAFVPLMGEGGAIVNITSIEGHRAGPGFAVYSAMKAAVENLTKTLALELAPRGIRVNAVAPDMISTPGDDELAADAAALSSDAHATPLGRYGAPADVAGPVLFLASPLAGFVTGTSIGVDGGNGAALGWRRSSTNDAWLL